MVDFLSIEADVLRALAAVKTLQMDVHDTEQVEEQLDVIEFLGNMIAKQAQLAREQRSL